MQKTSAPGSFLGRSPAVEKLLEVVGRAAPLDVPVLLTGETGTGKSHLARLFHARSRRSAGPFVAVNCAGFPEGLFESAFFGHRRGAFTGAVESKAGLFEEATGGTLFLDEAGELPLTQQAKLLTVIEERSVRPVGGTRANPVDARLVFATSRDLAAAVECGAFRADLYHRIALLRCEIPPLRTRPEDVELIAKHFLGSLARRYDRSGLEVSEPAWALLLGYAWPGNVRELAHVLEAAVILCATRTLRPEHIEPLLNSTPGTRSVAGSAAVDGATPSPASGRTAGRYSFFGGETEEREAIRQALVSCRGNRTAAALQLGMARNTLRERMRRYGLEQ